MTIIALTGYAEVGKSTVANYLVEQHGFTRLSFAAPLKRMILTLDPYVSSSFDDQFYRVSEILEAHGETEAKKLFPEYRRLLQVFGTDCIRAEDEHFWIYAAARQMTDPTADYVFDDCRFPNEAQFILDRSPEGLWNISRPGFEPVNAHISDQHAGNLGETMFITNDRTVEMLHTDIDAALSLAKELEDVL